VGVALIVLGVVLFLLTLGFAFTIYAFVAAFLSLLCFGAGTWLLARRGADRP
jgi:hypothetical protein